jgi:site-specific recombinase XerD
MANDELDPLDALIESWQLEMGVAQAAAGTRSVYRRGVNAYREFCTDRNIAPAFDKTSVQLYIAACTADYGRSVSTARLYLKGVRAFAAWATKEGELAADEVKEIKQPELKGTKALVHISLEQHQAMLDTCDPTTFVGRRDTAMLMMLKACGVRASELIGITVDDLTLPRRRALVHGKGSKDRIVAFDAETALSLDRYLRARRRQPKKDLPSLWLTHNGARALTYEGLNKMLERHAETAGVGAVHAHMWRHLWARTYLRDGGAANDLKVLGGWDSNDMVEHYTFEDKAERALEAYDRLYGNRSQ